MGREVKGMSLEALNKSFHTKMEKMAISYDMQALIQVTKSMFSMTDMFTSSTNMEIKLMK